VAAPSRSQGTKGPARCVSCLTPTGLCTAVEGEPDWILRLLLRFGLPLDQARGIVAGPGVGPVLDRRVTRTFPICGHCGLYTGFPTGLCIEGWEGEVPKVRQPEGGET
jgi:hypothetical protein